MSLTVLAPTGQSEPSILLPAETRSKDTEVTSREITVLTRDLPAGHQWLTPVIPTTQEAEIRRIMV
jgi:hypothetical protein